MDRNIDRSESFDTKTDESRDGSQKIAMTLFISRYSKQGVSRDSPLLERLVPKISPNGPGLTQAFQAYLCVICNSRLLPRHRR